MKLQGLSIIFGLIVIPMVLVLSYYIQLQVDTITLQNEYDAKLLDATHDAMVTFELNTANEDLSSVADSLRSIIDASNNIFMNTLATNLGLSNASKSYLEPYIPSVLYTLYDGYYINSPTKVPEIGIDVDGVALQIEAKKEDDTKFSIPGLSYDGTQYIYNPIEKDEAQDTDFNSLTSVPELDYGQLLYKKKNGCYTTDINDKNIVYNKEQILKSYIPYSARYVKEDKNIDVTINYTLDNYVTIIGNIGDIYYTKSGYLIDVNSVNPLILLNKKGAVFAEGLEEFNENDLEEQIKSVLKDNESIFDQMLALEQAGQKDTEEYRQLENQLSSARVTVKGANGTDTFQIEAFDLDSEEASAVIYYAKAKTFSKWVYDNLGDLKEGDIVLNPSNEILAHDEVNGEIVYSFENDVKIFDSSQNPEKDSSNFVNHKFKVIRNSIQYNLNLAMSIYNEGTTEDYAFNMPIISDEEWDKIMSNVSIVSFMQGLNCGLKKYNNYAIVSSTNNELTVIPSEIYYTSSFNDENTLYHRIDCPKLKEFLDLDVNNNKLLQSFVSKEVKYDKIYNKNSAIYEYDHKNVACYTCVVDGNYEPVPLEYTINDPRSYPYYVAIAKERYDLYKMNAIKNSEGYQMIYGPGIIPVITKPLTKVKKIEITFGIITANDYNESTVAIKFKHGIFSPNGNFILNTNQTKEQTIEVKIDTDHPYEQGKDFFANEIEIVSENSTVDINQLINTIKSIKVVYK